VGPDLLLGSRLDAPVRAAGGELVRGGPDAVDGIDTVFVDLNAPEGLEAIAELRRRGAATLVGFCRHTDAEMRRQAMAAGADQVITNGALEAAALRIVGGHTGG
jgi:DNA-binding NarL/FixJ family response regulator